jgi:molecular chaperone GrpE
MEKDKKPSLAKDTKEQRPSFAASDAATEGKKATAVPSGADDNQRKREGEKKLEDCEKLKKEYLSGWQRERADFLNYKKGELERVGELIKYADIGLILKILPILDNFNAAEKKITKELENDENIKGFLQIKSQIKDLLRGKGVEEIESLNKKFDPALHEIAEAVDTKGEESGIVIEEIQKGYKINGKVLRPARVKVIK